MASKICHATIVSAVLATGWFAAAVGARAEEPVAAGESLAVKWCARCHVIGDQNPFGGLSSTPSFWIMAEKPASYLPRIVTFQKRRPHRAMQFDVDRRDIDNIIAYVKRLKRK